MPAQHKCIFITGMGHSGTRLVTQMLNKHPDVSVPMSILNRVAEYSPLHQFFINSMDQTPLDSTSYNINSSELRSVLDAYMSNVDKNKQWFVLKLPYYPLNCLDFFVEYFKHNLVLINVKRPKAKVVNSFLSKGEGQSLFLANPVERKRQVKKLDLSIRKNHLASRDAKAFFDDLYDHTESKVVDWNHDHPEMPFFDIDIEKFATSKEFLRETLQALGLRVNFEDQMLTVVDKNRLLIKFTRKLRYFIPPAMVSWGSRFLRINRI